MAEGENSAFEKIINKIEETIEDLVTLEIITASTNIIDNFGVSSQVSLVMCKDLWRFSPRMGKWQ